MLFSNVMFPVLWHYHLFTLLLWPIGLISTCIELVVLWVLNREQAFARCFLSIVMANLYSTALGIMLVLALGYFVGDRYDMHITLLELVPSFGLAFLVSLAVETPVIYFTARSKWVGFNLPLSAVIANGASHLFIWIVILGMEHFRQVTGGY